MQILNIIKKQTERFLQAAGLGKKELSTRLYPPGRYARWPTYPSRGLTPDTLGAIFRQADNGNATRQAELFQEIEEKDLHLSAVLQTRRLAVTGNDWEVIPFSDDSRDAEAAEFIEDALSNIEFTTDEQNYEDFDGGLLSLLDAVGKGYAALELVWETGKEFRIKQMIWIDSKRFNFYKDYPAPRILTDKEPTYGEVLPGNKIIFHRHSARSGFTPRVALMRPCAWFYVFKNFSMKHWLRFSEAYGMPLRLGKIPNLDDKNAFDALKTALEELGTDASGIVHTDTEIEFIEAEKRASADIYKGFIEFCERSQSKAVLGQTLTTEIGDKGSFAASKTHGDVRQDILEADSNQLAGTIRRQLIRPLILFNFGGEFANRLPWFKFKYEAPEDLNVQAQRDKTLVDIGVPIGVSYFRGKYNLPEPQDGEEIVVPPGRVSIVPGFSPAGAGQWPILDDKKKRSLMYALPPSGRV